MTSQSDRRDAVRTFGGAVLGLIGAESLLDVADARKQHHNRNRRGNDSASAEKHHKHKKRGKQGPTGPIGPSGPSRIRQRRRK